LLQIFINLLFTLYHPRNLLSCTDGFQFWPHLVSYFIY